MQDWTIKSALEWAKNLLSSDGFASPGLDAELVLCHTANLRRIDLYIDSEKRLSNQQKDAFKSCIFRRLKGEPIAYITGLKEFYGLLFKVGPGVLIPRPETELLVEKAVAKAPVGSTVIEIGTGSGAVIISILASRPDLNGIASDISEDAIIFARENAIRHNVQDRLSFEVADGTDAIDGAYDVIVMNPPYVSKKDMSRLSADVLKFEPECALFGGEDGLAVIKKVLSQIDKHLSPGGILIMETGYNQQKSVNDICAMNKSLQLAQWLDDLAGFPRVAIIEKPAC